MGSLFPLTFTKARFSSFLSRLRSYSGNSSRICFENSDRSARPNGYLRNNVYFVWSKCPNHPDFQEAEHFLSALISVSRAEMMELDLIIT